MHVLHIWGKVHSLTESQCCINPIWLRGVPQGSILVSFMFYVIAGKAFAENSPSTSLQYLKGRGPWPNQAPTWLRLCKAEDKYLV